MKNARIVLIFLKLCSHNVYGQEPSSTTPLPDGNASAGSLSDLVKKTLEGYDHFIRPQIEEDYPLIIKVAVNVEAITFADEQSMEFEAIIYLRQTWVDTRLAFTFPDRLKKLSYIALPHDFVGQIWIPDTYFPMEKTSLLHDASVRNQAFKWYPNGTIFFTTRLTVKAICSMDLTNFPLDFQVCSLMMESYAYNDNDVVYTWETNFDALTFSENALKLLTQFELRGHRQSSTTESLSTGNYTLLECEFLLDRYLSYYMVAFYIPTTLVTIISGFAFFMDVSLIPERLALGVTTMLTITTLLLAVYSTGPKISYVKATDVFMGFCFALVFFALGESGVISFLYSKTDVGKRIIEERHKHIPPYAATESVMASEIEQKLSPTTNFGDGQNTSVQSVHQRRSSQSIQHQSKTSNAQTVASAVAKLASSENPEDKTDWRNFCVRCCRCQCCQQNYELFAKRLDFIGRILFPLTFLIFNLVYWIYYLNFETIQNEETWELKRTVALGRAFV